MAPRSASQLQSHKENKKQLILEAALRVFAGQGYNGASISEVAKAAGIAKGLLYTYFESKEALLDELIEFGLKKITALLPPPAPPGASGLETKEDFAGGLRQMIDLIRGEADFWRLYSMLILQRSMSERLQEQVGAFLQQYLSIYAVYFQKKNSSNPVAEAMLFGAILDGLMFDLLVAPDHYPLDEVMEMIIEKFA